MDDLVDRVAVVTGGASGIGRAMAKRFGQAGMKVVIADVEGPVLENTVVELESADIQTLGVICDVSDHSAMAKVGIRTEEVFGPPQLLCLNAGVGLGGSIVDTPLRDWKWVIDTNLWGVIHGLDVFLPGLIHRNEGHVVFTSSVCGHYSFPQLGPYAVTKHGVVAIAETLHAELHLDDSAVGVTCLCPGLVATNIFSSERNRPEESRNQKTKPPPEEEASARSSFLEWVAANALQAEEVAEMVHQAILNDIFWVFTDDEHQPAISGRHSGIRERKAPPTPRPLLEF